MGTMSSLNYRELSGRIVKEMIARNDNGKSIVYVLGAGASKAVIPDAPLMAQLLPEALNLFDEDPLYSHKPWSDRVRRIKDFINDFYNLNPGTLPNLEDILTQLDDALIENRSLSKDYDLPTIRIIREDLVYTICEILRLRLDDRQARGRHLMQQFMHKLGPNDSILSLNYDIIVDNALFQYRRARYVDYGLSVRYVLDEGKWERSYESPVSQLNLPPLYKLHGSLNWLYCSSCQQLDITIYMKGVQLIYAPDTNVGCPDCRGHYDPLIITPTLLKAYNNIMLREAWRRAEDKISKADEIVFIGYSLPYADTHLRCMLSRALYKNRIRHGMVQGEPEKCKIHVVGMSPPYSETHERYIKLFGEVEYHSDGFQGYLRQS
jgi:hypothetical protein